MSDLLTKVEMRIRENVNCLTQNESFLSWIDKEKTAQKDLIFINNSFVYRDKVKTNKNSNYLCLMCDSNNTVHKNFLAIAKPSSFNVDFKRFSSKSKNLPEYRNVNNAIKEQIDKLGNLVFVLVGLIDESVGCEESLGHSVFKTLRFEPSADEIVKIENKSVIVINTLQDPELVWNELESKAQKEGVIEGQLPDDLAVQLASVLQKLQEDAYCFVNLPDKKIDSYEQTILGQLISNLDRQCSDYSKSLQSCKNDPTRNKASFNNVLRIAYNFASDATKLLNLLISICDIKPILMWCTIAEHFQLAENFRNLPWAKSRKKPSLSNYESIISGARNRAFHDLFPFQRSIEVDVSEVSLRARRLRLFSPYVKKKANVLEYEDQEIVELLTKFTRAPETSVSFSFWRRNLEVMQSMQRLFETTADALITLRKSSS